MNRRDKKHIDPPQNVVNMNKGGDCKRRLAIVIDLADRDFDPQMFVRIAQYDFAISEVQQTENSYAVAHAIGAGWLGYRQGIQLAEVFEAEE